MKLFISLVILLLFGAVVPLIVSKKSKSGLVQFLSTGVGIFVAFLVILVLLVVVGVSTGILIP